MAKLIVEIICATILFTILASRTVDGLFKSKVSESSMVMLIVKVIMFVILYWILREVLNLV